MDLKVTARMRQAAPDECQQIDELRKERKAVFSRHLYLKNLGKQVEADEVLLRIAAIDAKTMPLHAAAKQKMLEGISEGLARDATVLQNVAKDIEKAGDAMAEENSRHMRRWRSSSLHNKIGTT